MRRDVLLTVGVIVAAIVAGPAAQTPAQWQDVIRNLRHPNANTRLDAVTRLGAAAYAVAAEPMAPLITDPDDRVQVAAIEAELAFFQSDRFDSPRGSSRAQQAFEAGPLFRAAAPAPAVVLERLVAAIRDENPRVRFDAVHAFGFLAEAPLAGAGARALGAELDHYDPTIRAATARVIGRLRARDAGDLVAAALADSSALVRLYATETLGLVGDPKGALELRAQLPRSRGVVLQATFLALARIGAREDMDFFRVRSTDRDAVFRRAAIEGLGRAGDAESTELFGRVLKSDRSPAVRAAAAFALTRVGRPETHTLGSMLGIDEVAEQVRDYLLEIGRPAIPGLEAALKVATQERHRAGLIMVIGYVGGADDAALLQPMASDKSEHVRRAVAQSVARLSRTAARTAASREP